MLSNRLHSFDELLEQTETDFTRSRKYNIHNLVSGAVATAQKKPLSAGGGANRNNNNNSVTKPPLRYAATGVKDGRGLDRDKDEDEEDGEGAGVEELQQFNVTYHGRKDTSFFCDMPRKLFIIICINL